MNPISIRLLNQQLIAPQNSKPEDVVAHFGAMQAQEYRMMRWAVEMRTKRPSEKAFTKAFNEGRIVRLHLLRGTWQLVSAEDYWWMLDLCAPKAKHVINGWMSSNKIAIADEELALIRNLIVETADQKGSVTKEDFEETLAAKGITMDNHRLSYHIRFAELDGVICSGDLLPMKVASKRVQNDACIDSAERKQARAMLKATYALSEKKIPRTEPIVRDWALARLATKYFQSHSPATLEDFVWWSGLNVGDCKRGIELIGNHLYCDSYKGKTFFLHENSRTRGFRKGEYLLIPPYDEYLIGYKSRDIVLDPAFKHFAHNNSGIFQPVIAYDGRICGNWSPFKEGLDASFFIGEHDEKNLARANEQYIRFKSKSLL